jgi:hypothetical protein
MAWIKRNLYFVITVAVALGVTGYCGYLLYSALGDNAAASEKYTSTKSQYDELLHKTPFPSKENIQSAEDDAARVRSFLSEFHKPFSPFPAPTKLDVREFNTYLLKIIAQFGAAATNAGVGMHADYAFSFSQQITKINHPAEAIAPWMQELEEIKAILQILYTAKINYLEKIKRVAVCTDDSGSDDYIQFNNTTNTWGVVSPYMVNFRAFSAEIANVLAGVAASSNCFIVKAIYVSPSMVPLPDLTVAQPAAAPMRTYVRPPPSEQFMQGPARRGRPGEGGEGRMIPRQYLQQPQQAEVPVTPAGRETFLFEKPLFVTIYIDVVKLKPAEPAPSAAKEARPSRRGAR